MAYNVPTFPLDFLSEGNGQAVFNPASVDRVKALIISVFSRCDIEFSEISHVVNPTVVRFELTLSGAYKINKIRACEDELNKAFSEYGSIRLITSGFAKETIVVEVQHPGREIVELRETLNNDNKNKKLPISFKQLIDLLMSDDEDGGNDDSIFPKDADMEKDSDKKVEVSFAELLDSIEVIDTSYKFPYEDYRIIGDTVEIDKIINTCGSINLSMDDIKSTLSTEAANYVSLGSANGKGCIVGAMKDAVDKLPIEQDCIAKMLFQIWMPKNMQSPLNEMKSMADLIGSMSSDIDILWGCAYDESLKEQARVTLIAASDKVCCRQ